MISAFNKPIQQPQNVNVCNVLPNFVFAEYIPSYIVLARHQRVPKRP